MKKKSNEDIQHEFAQLATDAESYHTSEISRQREKALHYYYGEPYGDEQPGRCSIVTREVFDTVEWMLPELLRVFTAGDRVVEFTPTGPEDVAYAKQETDYVNHVFMQKNEGFMVLHNWFKDALLQKNGIVKWYWDENLKVCEESYTNLSFEEAVFIAENDPDMELVEFEEVVHDEEGIVIAQNKATFKRRALKPCAKVINVPPEEFIISREARDIDSAPFVAHRKLTTRSEMLEMGFSEKDLEGITFTPEAEHDGIDSSPERRARHRVDYSEGIDHNASPDPSQDKVWLWESYFMSDIEGNGKAKLIKVFTANDEVIEWEEAPEKPFSSITPCMIPHKFHGLSIHDTVHDIQEVKSQLTRSMIDNAQFMNHGRWGVMEGQVNMDDLIHSRPGGIVRVKTPNALNQLATPTLDGNTFPLMDYMDQLREKRTGISNNSMGLNPDALRSNVAASTHNNVMTASMQKRDLIARLWAETGVKRLFCGLHGLILRNQDEADFVKLNNTYVKVDPTKWRERYDVTVTVGLGTGNKDQRINHYTMLTQLMMQLAPMVPGMFGPENAYNWLKEGFLAAGYKNYNDFLTAPEDQPPPQEPGPSEEMQIKMAEMQQKMQLEAAKLQETTRHNQKTEELQEAEVVRKTMADEEDAAINRAELALEERQGRPVEIG